MLLRGDLQKWRPASTEGKRDEDDEPEGEREGVEVPELEVRLFGQLLLNFLHVVALAFPHVPQRHDIDDVDQPGEETYGGTDPKGLKERNNRSGCCRVKGLREGGSP